MVSHAFRRTVEAGLTPDTLGLGRVWVVRANVTLDRRHGTVRAVETCKVTIGRLRGFGK